MSEKVFAPRLARRTFLAASAASAALMLTGCLNLAPRYEKPAAPTETSQDWAVSPRDAGRTPLAGAAAPSGHFVR